MPRNPIAEFLSARPVARRATAPAGAVALMRMAVELGGAARDEFWADPRHHVARRRPLVAASIGPFGAMLGDGSEYRGNYALDDAALGQFHRRRLAVLAGAGADLLAIESIPSLREALVLANMLENLPPHAAWISFTCKDDFSTSEGQDVADCASAMDAFPQIAAIGVNCTAPEHVAPLLRRMRKATAKPLLAYPNSGELYDAAAKQCVGGAAHQRFAGSAREWHEAGARLIGGCCRTTPQDIREIRAWSEELRVA